MPTPAFGHPSLARKGRGCREARLLSNLPRRGLFSDKLRAHNVVAMFVWPDGEPTCHHCGAKNAHFMEKYLRYGCRNCRKDFTVKTGAIKELVESGSAVHADAHGAYRGLNEELIHDYIDHAVKYAEGAVHTDSMENFWSLLKRGLKGTYVAVTPIHLARFVDEQAYRFNERGCTDGEWFLKVLRQVVGRRRLTWADLTNIGKDGFWMLLTAQPDKTAPHRAE